MTTKITPEAVKERIAALESAGELSLKEQFYLEALRLLVAAMDSEPVALTANIERDAQRYRFLRERDAFGDDGEPGLASWDDLVELDTNEFDAAIDARMAHPSVDFITLDNALQKHERRRCKDRNCNKPIYGYSVDGLCEDCYTAISQQPAPVVPDGIELVANTLEHIGNFADAAIIRQLAANQPQNAPQNIPEIIPDSCTWTFSNYDDHWSGTCGVEWIFPDGGPEENGVKFCPKCGKSVAISATE